MSDVPGGATAASVRKDDPSTADDQRHEEDHGASGRHRRQSYHDPEAKLGISDSESNGGTNDHSNFAKLIIIILSTPKTKSKLVSEKSKGGLVCLMIGP